MPIYVLIKSKAYVIPLNSVWRIKYMLGYKATHLEGMKSTGPLRCLLVKLNCMNIESWFWHGYQAGRGGGAGGGDISPYVIITFGATVQIALELVKQTFA